MFPKLVMVFFFPKPVRLGFKKALTKPKQYSKTKSDRAGVAYLLRQAETHFLFKTWSGVRLKEEDQNRITKHKLKKIGSCHKILCLNVALQRQNSAGLLCMHINPLTEPS